MVCCLHRLSWSEGTIWCGLCIDWLGCFPPQWLGSVVLLCHTDTVIILVLSFSARDAAVFCCAAVLSGYTQWRRCPTAVGWRVFEHSQAWLVLVQARLGLGCIPVLTFTNPTRKGWVSQRRLYQLVYCQLLEWAVHPLFSDRSCHCFSVSVSRESLLVERRTLLQGCKFESNVNCLCWLLSPIWCSFHPM